MMRVLSGVIEVAQVLYTLAGVVDPAQGWGVRDDTHVVQSALRELGRPSRSSSCPTTASSASRR
jgi:hypothetical protein